MAKLVFKEVPEKLFVVEYPVPRWNGFIPGTWTLKQDGTINVCRVFWKEGQANNFAKQHNGKVLYYTEVKNG